LRFKVTRESDHKRVERTRVIGRVQDFPTVAQAFAEAERLGLYTIEPGSKRGTLNFAILAEFYLQELKKVPDSKKRRPRAASTIEDRERIIRKRLLPRFGERDALKIKPSEIKAWLESVQDEEDLENSTVDKIRRVMNLVYSMAQASDLIPRTADANPVKHVHIATTTGYEAILVTPQDAWNIICRMGPFARLMTLLIAVTGLRIGEVLALKWRHVDWSKFRIHVVSNFVRGKFGEPKSAASKRPVVLHSLVMGLLKNWRETTAYAGNDDFVFASDRLKGKAPRGRREKWKNVKRSEIPRVDDTLGTDAERRLARYRVDRNQVTAIDGEYRTVSFSLVMVCNFAQQFSSILSHWVELSPISAVVGCSGELDRVGLG
jgi:integrase